MLENIATCFVFGASGHGKVVVDAIHSMGHCVSVLVDDDPAKVSNPFFGIDVVSFRELVTMQVGTGVVAIGDNGIRKKVVKRLQDASFSFRQVIHARACVADSVAIGDGTVIFAGAVLNSDARIGNHVIVNTSSSVDHDCCIGDFTHVAPGVRLCGGVSVGEAVLIGAGSVVLPGITIGAGALIGAGSVVTRDIPENGRVAGNPAKQITGKNS